MLWACLASWVAFWIIAPFVPRLYLFDFVNAISVTYGLAVLKTYLPGAVLAIRLAWRGVPLNQGHYLVLGVVATWLAMIGRTSYLQLWRSANEPAGGLDHLMMAFVAWLIVSGGALHRISPNVKEGIIPAENKRGLVQATVIGIIFACVLFVIRWRYELT